VRRLQAAANVADGGQGGRKEAGPILRPLTGGEKTKGLDEQGRQLGRGTLCTTWALGPHWLHSHWVTLTTLFPISGPISSISK
jgi:hypothetical protein